MFNMCYNPLTNLNPSSLGSFGGWNVTVWARFIPSTTTDMTGLWFSQRYLSLMCLLSCSSFLVAFSETQTTNNMQSTSAPGTSTNHASPPTSVNTTSTTMHQTTSATPTANVTSQTPVTPSTPTQSPNQTEETSPSLPAQTTTTNQTSDLTGSSRPSVQVTSGSASTSGDTTINPTSAGQTPTVTWLCTKVYAPQTFWGISTSLKCHMLFHLVVKLQNTNYFVGKVPLFGR